MRFISKWLSIIKIINRNSFIKQEYGNTYLINNNLFHSIIILDIEHQSGNIFEIAAKNLVSHQIFFQWQDPGVLLTYITNQDIEI